MMGILPIGGSGIGVGLLALIEQGIADQRMDRSRCPARVRNAVHEAQHLREQQRHRQQGDDGEASQARRRFMRRDQVGNDSGTACAPHGAGVIVRGEDQSP
jgi:hypothetical protein